MDIERKKWGHVVLDIAPLVDVVFLLLLFFIMTSRIVSEPAIHMSLPRSTTATLQHEGDVQISITKRGQVYVGELPVSLEEIPSAIRDLASQNPNPSARIKADKDAPLGLVVRVIDQVRISGISHFSIVTERM